VAPVLLQPFPGFLTLQLMVDRWALNTSVPLARMDGTRVLQDLFVPALAYVLEANAGLSAAVAGEYARLNATGRLGAVAADVLQWMRAEALAPQHVTLVPFPVSGFQSNAFYGTVLPLFAFFFVIVVLFPVSRLIRGVVMEKEAKIREGMRMMGLTDASWYFSWVAMYAAYFAVLAGLIALVTSRNFFSKSSGGVIWAFFFLFGLSCTSFAMLISVFFSKAKTASTLGVVLYLGGYFPFFALQPADISTNAKLAGALLAPTAFGLGVDLIGTMEDNGTGATVASSRASINAERPATEK
jgi:hypothetical protein